MNWLSGTTSENSIQSETFDLPWWIGAAQSNGLNIQQRLPISGSGLSLPGVYSFKRGQGG
jgi:hypothetical protein